MNAIGMMLAGSIAHATLFAAAGIAAYLALRHRGPAAGSLAAVSGLAVMAAVSIVMLSPWPRWWVVGKSDRAGVAAGIRGDSGAGAGPKGPINQDPTRSAPPPPPIGPSEIATPSALELILKELPSPADA